MNEEDDKGIVSCFLTNVIDLWTKVCSDWNGRKVGFKPDTKIVGRESQKGRKSYRNDGQGNQRSRKSPEKRGEKQYQGNKCCIGEINRHPQKQEPSIFIPSPPLKFQTSEFLSYLLLRCSHNRQLFKTSYNPMW